MRSYVANKHMQTKNIDYLMAPVRFFEKAITHIDSFHNFVFAADLSGRVGVFLLDENDLEDEDGTMLQREDNSLLGQEIRFLKFFPQEMRLIVVSAQGVVCCWRIEQLANIDMVLEKLWEAHTGPTFTKIGELLVTDCGNNRLLLCNQPKNRTIFEEDQSLVIFNIAEGNV